MTIIFKTKSREAYVIKILAELLATNIKTGCFVIDETGIYLCMMDHHRRILINLKLNAEGFLVYKFNSKKLFLGINLNHFHKMIKSIKKKDSIELYIDDENPNDLAIKVIPKENNRTTISFIKIQSIQNLDIDIPTGYKKPVSISSSEYQKIIKDMGNIGNIMNISSKKFSIEFSCNAGGILKRKVRFGEVDDDDDDDDNEKEFNEDFNTEQLCRISKLAGLSSNIQIFPGKPLLFKSNVGTLGFIEIYIKSKDQLETESCIIDSESETED